MLNLYPLGLARGKRTAAALCAAAVLFTAAPAAAQASDPNPGAVTVTGGIDFLNAYYFRGIPQDESGVIMWPYGDLGFALYTGDGALKSISVNVGTWNSLHTGDAGLDGPTEKLWYESDFYSTLGIGFSGPTTLGVTYTAYTSPNGLFGTVKELSFKLAHDDSGYLGRMSMKPYVLLARELSGQADAGLEEGTYLELGVAPGFSATRASLAMPVKVGLSLGDYYEGAQGDERFGFFSIGALATVPFSSAPTQFGTWNIHGGVDYMKLGDRNRALLAFGDDHTFIGSVGIGFTY